jgi:RNase H-fold protein (predicted Holliday junction resolvase)
VTNRQNGEESYLLAVDPGRQKCGLAVLGPDGRIVVKMIAPRGLLIQTISDLLNRLQPDRIAVGDGTGSAEIVDIAEKLAPGRVSMIPERNTTLEARDLAWHEKPPGGLWRCLPRLFWPSPRDLDAWAAVVIGRRALAARRGAGEAGP